MKVLILFSLCVILSLSSSAPVDSPPPNKSHFFRVQSYSEGIPYLHRQFLTLQDSSLFVGSGRGSGEPFVGYLSRRGELQAARDKSTVYVNQRTGEVKVENRPFPTDISGRWDVDRFGFLQLNQQSWAWACPQGRSSRYKIFWKRRQPNFCDGGVEVQLYVSDTSWHERN